MAKLLLFSDLHADTSAARRLAGMARSADILVGAGDFGTVRRNVGLCVDVLKATGKPAVFVAGNNETTDELTQACRGWSNAHVLHGTSIAVDGVTFFGLGGGVPVTPFGSWSYDFSEQEAASLLINCPPGCVLISHSPPQGVVDRTSGGESLGSTAVRDAILRVHPVLVVCGHIHHCGGRQEMLATTPVVNAGPHGTVWDVH